MTDFRSDKEWTANKLFLCDKSLMSSPADLISKWPLWRQIRERKDGTGLESMSEKTRSMHARTDDAQVARSAGLLELLGFRIAPLYALSLTAAAIETILWIVLEVHKHGAADRALHEGRPA